MQKARIGRMAWTTNADTSSFASRIPTITEPTNDGVFVMTPPAQKGGLVAKRVRVMVLGLGADNDAAAMRVIGWQRVTRGTLTPIWVPVIQGEFTCTFS